MIQNADYLRERKLAQQTLHSKRKPTHDVQRVRMYKNIPELLIKLVFYTF